MRRTLAAVLLASTALLTAGGVASAGGFCGGGQPGEPCYCPSSKLIPIYC
jgi:hypothetical protein